MINNDKNLWRNRGFLAHGMKENQKTYWRNELSLLLSEAPSVDSKYREIITKNNEENPINRIVWCSLFLWWRIIYAI